MTNRFDGRMLRSLGWCLGLAKLLLLVPSLALAMDPSTAALITGGGLGAIGLGVQSLTNSKLEVTVDRYTPTKEELDLMRLGRQPALARSVEQRRRAAADPAVSLDKEAMSEVASQLRPIMNGMRCIEAATQRSIAQLEQIIQQFSTASQREPFRRILNDFRAMHQGAAKAIESWNSFQSLLTRAAESSGRPQPERMLGAALVRLREQLLGINQYQVSDEYVDLLVSQLEAAMIADVRADQSTTATDQKTLIDQISKLMADPYTSSARSAGRLAEVFDRVRQVLALGKRSGAWPTVDRTLLAFGLNMSMQQLGKLKSREAIETALIGPGDRMFRADSNGECGGSAFLPKALGDARDDAIDATFAYSRLLADVNFGPIRSEVMQVLMTGNDYFRIISDPENEARWRPFSSARSDGGSGNLDSIIYFENMGHPILKTSAFDPTKFIVAHGALYRQVFAATAGVFGAPSSGTGAKESASNTQNIFAARGRLQTAKKAVATQQTRILSVLKYCLDEQVKVNQASANWAGKKDDLVKEVREGINKLADQLDAVGSGQ